MNQSTGKTQLAVGQHLRRWREARRMSQMEVAQAADVSTRHLSFIETGRSKPSRALVLNLGRNLNATPREQNAALLAAGFAPAFRESELNSAEMQEVRKLLGLILRAQEPYPAMVLDGRWNLIEANASAQSLTQALCQNVTRACAGQAPNLLRLIFHPEGIGPSIENWDEVALACLARIKGEMEAEGNEALLRLHSEIRSYPAVVDLLRRETQGLMQSVPGYMPILIPLKFRQKDQVVQLASTVTTLGTAQDITLQDLRIETFYPLDADSEAYFEAKTE